MVFNISLLIAVSFLMRLYTINSLSRVNFVTTFNRLFLSATLFLFFTTFSLMNYLLDYYQEMVFVSYGNTIEVLSTYCVDKMFHTNALGLNLVQVYCFPFIYVFLLVTVLSIVFCLTYNVDELFSFMFYCQVILLAGYILFFTDSIM